MEKGFDTLWSSLEHAMALPHFMYANLEGPTAGPITASGREVVPDPGLHFDNVAYTSYPQFNYHPNLVRDLRSSGIDVVSTANNHALDRRAIGADRTNKALEKYGMPFTGTQTSADTARSASKNLDWTTTTENAGFKIGWVACTFSTNGIPDTKNQVLHCFEQRSIVLQEIRRLHADPSIDAVIVTPHWGVEYDHVPGAPERALAKDMIEAGALIVFGGHPHVLQPTDKITASDGREGFVIYSLGNFVSGQKGVAKRTAALIYVGLTKNSRGEVFVNGTRHLPIAMMYTREGLTAMPAKGNYEEARTLANEVLARSREITPGAPVITNPECR
jgi:poly-gamma-glutamate synthesis protein (capsule biosynthesis protein)